MRFLAILAAALVAATSAFAQQANQVRVRGVVEAMEGPLVRVATRGGPPVEFRLADNYQVMEIYVLDPAKIGPGDFVGAGAKRARDGSLQAVQIVVFPESLRGTGEGHRDWNVVPDGTMTNATVGMNVEAVGERGLTLRWGDQSVVVNIPKDATVVTFQPIDRSALRPGAQISLGATRAPDGSLLASRVLVGRDGFVPPI